MHRRSRCSTGALVALALALAGCKAAPAPTSDTATSATQQRADSEARPTSVGSSSNVAVTEQVADGSIYEPPAGGFALRDQTGTLWNFRGEAFAGKNAGKRLAARPGFSAFWFAWSAFHDGSELWPKGQNQTSSIGANSECGVPCSEILMGCPGKDCIPALNSGDGAKLVRADSAGAEYLSDDDMVLGVFVDGRARAYPHNILWWHEIVNDQIGDHRFSVTFCPLTGSGIVFDGSYEGNATDFGVSGRLFNSNLIMYDRQSDSFWSQMLFRGIKGEQLGKRLTVLPVLETTWQRWKELHPQTLVVSIDTGHVRNYRQYPYGDYRTDHSNTFRPTTPPAAGTHDKKDRVFGLVGKTPRLYAHKDLQKRGARTVVNDTFESKPVVVLWDGEHRSARAFSAELDGKKLTFEYVPAPQP